MQQHNERPPLPNDWIVGLDLGGRSRGALVFIHWLDDGSDRVTGMYVLEAWARPYVGGDVASTVHHAVFTTACELDISPPARVHIVEAERAEEALAQAAQNRAGLVLGRAARAGEASLVHLGRVARRLLRILPGPVVVVPPDLATVAPGPILVATNLDLSTSAALPFARALAARHDRPLELVHIGELRHNDLIDEPSWLAAREEYRSEVECAINVWMHDHHLDPMPCHIAYGDPAEEIVEIAAARQAALVVVGSRRLGTGVRMFVSSAASRLAGLATCPVAVVPPVYEVNR